MSGAEGNVTTDRDPRRRLGSASLLFESGRRGHREEWRRLEASKGWKRQWADPLPEPPKKTQLCDLLILALYIRLIFRLMTTRTVQLEIGLL